MNKTKYLEYYMDSKIYSKDEVQKSIDETKKEFSNKEVSVQVSLNEFGVYIITFVFKNKSNFIKNIFIKLKMKKKSKLLLVENQEKYIEMQNKNVNQIIKTKKSEKGKVSKQDKIQKRFEKYNNKVYGQYKATHTYKPY